MGLTELGIVLDMINVDASALDSWGLEEADGKSICRFCFSLRNWLL